MIVNNKVCRGKLSEFATVSYTPLHHFVPSGWFVSTLKWNPPELKLNVGGLAEFPVESNTNCRGWMQPCPAERSQETLAIDSPVTTDAACLPLRVFPFASSVNFRVKLLPALMTF